MSTPDRVVAVDASVAMCQFLTAMPEIINRNGQNIRYETLSQC